MQTRSARLADEDGRLLASLLEIEDRNYRRLLRLAWRQNSYMKRQDVHRLEANAADWARHLPGATEARTARERFVRQLGAETALPEGVRVRELLPSLAPGGRREVEASLAVLDRTTARLARQNELNRHLADFCLEMAREEARIYRDVLLDDPAGCYDQGARTCQRGAGGVIVRQA
ncbi:hypothetical protein DRQ50_05890 [bacterium]|nr:MAG: hypothetical protein DRQ50_05890 [bacterium]